MPRIIAFLLLLHYFTPWPYLWPLTLNMCSVSSVTWWNSVSNLNAIAQSAAVLLRFQCLTLWPWHVLSVALGSGIIFTKFDLRQLIPAWIIALFWCWYVMSSCDLDFWPVDLENSWYIKCQVTWSKSVRNLSEIEQSPAESIYKSS